MSISETATEITKELADKFNIDSVVKGSVAYGIPHENSDIDIQLVPLSSSQQDLLQKYFSGTFDQVEINDPVGQKYTSKMISFQRNGFKIDLIWDSYLSDLDYIKKIISYIAKLPLEEKYIIRAVGGGLKYVHAEAVQRLLEVYKTIEPILSRDLTNTIRSGGMMSEPDAALLRKVVFILYDNQYNAGYKKYL